MLLRETRLEVTKFEIANAKTAKGNRKAQMLL